MNEYIGLQRWSILLSITGLAVIMIHGALSAAAPVHDAVPMSEQSGCTDTSNAEQARPVDEKADEDEDLTYEERLARQLEEAREAHQEQPDDARLQFEYARALYFVGLAGDSDANEQGEEILLKVHAKVGDDAKVLAYLGSSRLLHAARTWRFWAKQSLADEGLELLDKAVKLAPNNAEVLFIRAATTYNLPGWFDRREQSKADFAKLAEIAPKAAADDKLDKSLAAAAMFHHGVFLEEDDKTDQAIKAWQTAHDIDPKSPAGIDARKMIKKHQD